MSANDIDLQQQLCDFVQQAILHPKSSEYEQLITMVVSLVVNVAPREAPSTDAPGASEQDIEHMRWILHAMSSTASSLHEETHEQLLRTLFQLHFWHTPAPILAAWTDLLLHLLYARPAFHQPCINHLVRNLYPPPPQLQHAARQAARDEADAAAQQPEQHVPSAAELAAHEYILGALNHVVMQHPLLRDTITAAITAHSPHRYQPRVALCAHFRGVFALAESPAGAALRDALFFGAAEKMVEMDCDVRWEGIVQALTGQEAEAGPSEDEGEEEDVFAVGAMEHLHLGRGRTGDAHGAAALDGLGTATDAQLGWEGHAHGCGRRDGGGAGGLGAEESSSLAMAHKLDPLMLMLFQHMHARAADADTGGGARLWRTCTTLFERVLQLSQRVKFTPYIMFLGARLAGVLSARDFAAALVTRVCTPGEHKVCRTSCAAYAASFLARFAQLPLVDVVACVHRLADFCTTYATSAGAPPRQRSPPKRASTEPGKPKIAHLSRRATMPALTDGAPSSNSMRRQSSATAVAQRDAPDWERHEVFYAACQAAMYSLCYHMHVLDERPEEKAAVAACADLRKIVADGMVPLMGSELRPLEVCLPTVSREFVRQVARHHLGALPLPAVAADAMTRHDGRAAFEMFFPFDPYLLPVSAPALDLATAFRSWRGGHVVADAAAADAAVDGDPDEDDDTDTRGGDRSSEEEDSQLESDDDEEVFGTSAPSEEGAQRTRARDITGSRRKVYDRNPFATGGDAPMSMDDRGQYDDAMHAFALGSSPEGHGWMGESPGAALGMHGAAPGGGAAGGEAMSLTEEAPWGQMRVCRGGQGGGGAGGGAPLVAMHAGSAVGGGLAARSVRTLALAAAKGRLASP
eukprot:jgi/Ulvmu1/688/UM010_0060.1